MIELRFQFDLIAYFLSESGVSAHLIGLSKSNGKITSRKWIEKCDRKLVGAFFAGTLNFVYENYQGRFERSCKIIVY